MSRGGEIVGEAIHEFIGEESGFGGVGEEVVMSKDKKGEFGAI